jgi:hypothetical protein
MPTNDRAPTARARGVFGASEGSARPCKLTSEQLTRVQPWIGEMSALYRSPGCRRILLKRTERCFTVESAAGISSFDMSIPVLRYP